ncbi:MAG: hypothetical protein MUC88_17985 [Planctomycetes bacterium]|nr:hypothetical protein [Planctomycetota bacterium]
MRIGGIDPHQTPRSWPESSHEYFYSGSAGPWWYQEEIRGVGRRYEIESGKDHGSGEVIVDDEQHVVYVRLAR